MYIYTHNLYALIINIISIGINLYAVTELLEIQLYAKL